MVAHLCIIGICADGAIVNVAVLANIVPAGVLVVDSGADADVCVVAVAVVVVAAAVGGIGYCCCG